MPGGIISTELKAVEELLSGGKTFTVPKYQRNFSWTKDEVKVPWDDSVGVVGNGSRNGPNQLFTNSLSVKIALYSRSTQSRRRLHCRVVQFNCGVKYWISIRALVSSPLFRTPRLPTLLP